MWNNAEDVYELLEKARENRVVADTSSNERSSRSHSLFQLIIKASHPKINGGVQTEGAINLIDLAGSERLHKQINEKQVLSQSIAINKSLSWLREVIGKLVERERIGIFLFKKFVDNKQSKSRKGKDKIGQTSEIHIPYRNSKLTYILQPYLSSESSKILMIVNVSPLFAHSNETVNSLRFASEVNSCIINKKDNQFLKH